MYIPGFCRRFSFSKHISRHGGLPIRTALRNAIGYEWLVPVQTHRRVISQSSQRCQAESAWAVLHILRKRMADTSLACVER